MSAHLTLKGLRAPVEIFRDSLGIAHMRATSVADAFFAQGYVHAQDRLWQMDCDRMRALGRWAEYAGRPALEQDALMRRLRLGETARRDYNQVEPETRAMLDAYCAGVNAFIETADELPMEYGLLGARPEPWRPWEGMALYKVRHVLMGVWEGKLWRARLVKQVGAEGLARLYPTAEPGHLLILPPGAELDGLVADAVDELLTAMAGTDWMQEDGGGSNSWVLDGSRTESGKPLLAGDPHRAVEVPGVYYQNHLACDQFDVVGLSFPGLPGFPHFGHNGSVAWCITHGMADTQDIFIERFDPANPARYLYKGEWRDAEVRKETIRVRGAEPAEIDVVITHHGPVIAGEPASGQALAMRYTATLETNTGWDCLLPMLRAHTGPELDESMRGWVDPVNNLLYADVEGTIGYRTRGWVPVRGPLNAWLPVPGWTGEHEWQDMIPFAELPALRNPAAGYIVTANNRITGPDYKHYFALYYAADHRARRIVERLLALERHTVESLTAIHGDVISRPAQQFQRLLPTVAPRTAKGAEARAILGAWDGQVKAGETAPAIFNVMREHLLSALLEPQLGPLGAEAFASAGRGGPNMVSLIRARVFAMAEADDQRLLPPGANWPDLITGALESAVAWLEQHLGPDISRWEWGRLHKLRPVHPLSGVFPAEAGRLSPAPAPMDGDADTVQAAGYLNVSGFIVTGASVARYVFDPGDWERSAWVVPHGASGHQGSPHFADQAGAYLGHRLYPMLYRWERIEAEAAFRQSLIPQR